MSWKYKNTDEPEGGPAFGHGNPQQGGDPGMSLRDWFAGQAVMKIVPNNAIGPDANKIAAYAFEIADAMLAQRAKPTGAE